MSSYQLLKLDPTFAYLRGVAGFGAFASIHNASSSGFTATGVFRDAADFAVIVIADEANGSFDHGQYLRALPDYDYTGLTLSFDLTTNGLWPIDSRYYATTDALRLDVITHDLTTGVEQPLVCSLWQHATYKSGSFTAATVSFTVTHDPTPGDILTLFVGNTAFQYLANVSDTATTAASSLAYQINNYDWSTFAQASVSVFATWDGSTGIVLTFARTGKVSVSGSTVTWQANGVYPTALPSEVFVGLQAGDPIYIAGSRYNVLSVTDAQHLTVIPTPPATSSATYLAPMGGSDGNALQCYIVMNPYNTTLAVSSTTLNFSGGNSDGVTWTINLPFGSLNGVTPANASASGAPQIAAGALRQAWMTLAPQIKPNGQYTDTQWSCVIANWSVTGSNRNLSIAGPGSVRVDSRSAWCKYSGIWSQDAENTRYLGFAMVSSIAGSSVTVQYSCGQIHDLYIGTEIYVDRQVVNVSLDGDANTQLDTYANETSPIPVRRKVRSSAGAGTHYLTITTNGTHNASAIPAGGLYSFLFDFLEAAVPGLVQDPAVTYSNVTAALDYDTFAYQVAPARVVWQLQRLGFLAQVNLYLGVFWWAQRVRIGGSFSSVTVTFTTGWQANDSVILDLGGQQGFPIGKSVVAGDNPTSIAAHFAYYINSASSGFWASSSAGVLTITQRSFGSEYSTSVSVTVYTTGTATATVSNSTIPVGTEGTWQINDAASPVLNVGAIAWLTDFYATLNAAGMTCSTAISQELVNPPSGYVAQFADGSAVATDTGFSSLVSNQCAIGSTKTLTLQKAVLAELAGLQSAAGIPVYLQLGEVLWWFFSRKQSVSIGYVANTFPASIGITAHGMSTGQTCLIVGALDGSGNVSAINGTWTVTVTDADHFTIAIAGGTWTAGTGVASYGGQAYYDSETQSAAAIALGRPLVSFWTQDDPITAANTADATFLAQRLFAHWSSLISYVKGLYPSASVEILWPQDVNNSAVYWNASWSFGQGGRTNAVVNAPSQLQTKANSGFSRIKMEALSWSASYRNLDLAKTAIAFPTTAPFAWAIADTAYLIPCFNGGTFYAAEFLAAFGAGIPLLLFWASDQLQSMALPINPLPQNSASVSSS